MLKSRFPEIIAALPASVEEGLSAGAEIIVAAAKVRVPVKSGRLREAIHAEAQPEGVYVIAGNNKAWYGHIVEHGSVNMAAQPFLLPAVEESVAAVAAAAGEALGRAVS